VLPLPSLLALALALVSPLRTDVQLLALLESPPHLPHEKQRLVLR
jgi:hypothetical protein